MTIVHVANIRLPTEKAHGIQIMKMCEAFSDLGVEMELVVPRRSVNVLRDLDPFAYYGIEKKFAIKYLSAFDPAFLRKFKQGTYIKVQLSFFAVSLFFHLLFNAAKHKIFYTRNEYLLPVLLWFSKEVVWETHNIPQNIEHYLRYLKKCRFIVAISQGLKEKLLGLGISEQKILVAHDGVDLKKFQIPSAAADQIREELRLPLDKKIIMYTGHLYEWKGASVLLEVAQKSSIPSQSPLKIRGEAGGIVFVFVGGTEHDISRFRQKAKDLDNVLILGHRPHSEIPKYLAAADVLVLPNSAKKNISKYYTSPMKLFEYMASGRPIAASDLPSLREVLNEDTAVFALPDDPESLTLAIQKILSDKELSARIGQNSKELVKTFTWDGRAKKILNFIHETVNYHSGLR